MTIGIELKRPFLRNFSNETIFLLMEAIGIKSLKSALLKSWSQETSFPRTKDQWNSKNPSFGQCAVTSLIVNDICGGKIVFNKDYHHYWNVLDDGTVVDFTKDQFGKEVSIPQQGEASREYILESEAAHRALTPARYKLLKGKVEKVLLLFVE